MTISSFIHLRVHSGYSLAEGAIKVVEDKPKEGAKAPRKDLIKLCLKQDMPAVALTDKGNLFGALEFSMAASEAGIQPIIGCQIAVLRPEQRKRWQIAGDGHGIHWPEIDEDLSSEGMLQGAPAPHPFVAAE